MSDVGYDFENEEEEYDEHFRIDGSGTANWALAKLRYYKRREQEIKDLHRQEVERLDEWAKGEQAKLDRPLTYFESLLTNWHREQFEADEKRKSIVLPNGKLKSIAGKDKVVPLDEDAFFAAAPDGLIRVKKEIDKTATLKHVKETGELLPGIAIESGERTFKVEISE
jgi:hypothetical protein